MKLDKGNIIAGSLSEVLCGIGSHKNHTLPRLPIDSSKAAYFPRPPDRAKLGIMWNYAMKEDKFQHSRPGGLQMD